MNILVFGAGAVGLAIASTLIKTGYNITIASRGETLSSLKTNGIKIIGIFGEWATSPNQFGLIDSSTLSNITANTPFDLILICVKSYDSRATAELIKNNPFLYSEKTKFILFQNGWGNAEIFAEYFDKANIYNARVITGFTKPLRYISEITVHADDIKIGSLFSDDLTFLTPLCHSITKGGIPCMVSPKIEKDLWAKMLYNCALNPTGAIFSVAYGKLSESKYSKNILNSIIHEIFSVMSASVFSTHWDTPAEYISVFYEKQIPSTYKHESSMLQDIKAGSKTEIEALTGQVIMLGKLHNIPTPVNETIYNMIKFIEK